MFAVKTSISLTARVIGCVGCSGFSAASNVDRSTPSSFFTFRLPD
jgi:hypothetical protein